MSGQNPKAARPRGHVPPVSDMTGDFATVTRELAPDLPRPPVSVVILTFNEADNIGPCIDSCAWCDDIHVLDSGSTDGTQEIALARGATVHENPFKSFGQQRNWAIDNIKTRHDWQLQLDADERCTAGMVEEMHRRLPTDEVDAFRCPSMLVFMNRWLRHASEYPVYQVRLFNKHKSRFADHGHGQTEDLRGPVGSLAMPYVHHNFSKGLEEWFEKHNRYSSLEALEIRDIIRGKDLFASDIPPSLQPRLFGNTVQRRRWVKSKIYPRLPAKWVVRFIWMYLFRLGVLDGLAGLRFCLCTSAYELLIDLKITELRLADKGIAQKPPAPSRQPRPQPSISESRSPVLPKPVGDRHHHHHGNGADRHHADLDNRSRAGNPTSSPVPRPGPTTQEDDVGVIKTTSPWTTKQNIGRVLWATVEKTLFRWSFHNWYGWRNALLRLFGASVHPTARLRRSVHIEIPWNLTLHEYAGVGDEAILYCLGPVTVGTHATISQYAHICAGTHDFNQPTFPLIRPPIVIGPQAWIAADAFVGPGVTVGEGAILGARGCAFRDLEPWTIHGGNPAKPLRPRVRFDTQGNPYPAPATTPDTTTAETTTAETTTAKTRAPEPPA